MKKKVKDGMFSLDTDPKKILEDVVNQFVTPEMCYRELIQNSLDAGASRIDVKFNYDDAEKKLEIIVDDSGEGMNHADREKFLLKLFSSSKEGNLEKIGRFGIGFKSVLSLEPDELWIESSKGGEDWLLLVDKDLKYYLYDSAGRIGTKVSVVKNVDKATYKKMEAAAKASIAGFCQYAATPLFFNDDRINKEIELDSLVKLHFKNKWGEGIIAPSNNPSFELLNNRLSVKSGEGRLEDIPEDWSIIITSKYIKTNISRNDVQRDENYNKIIEMLKGLSPQLLLEYFKVFSDAVAKEGAFPKDKAYTDVTNTVLGYLQRKDLQKPTDVPAEILAIPLLPTTDGKLMSLSDALAQKKKKGSVFFADRRSDITAKLEEKGIRTVLTSEYAGPYKIIGRMGETTDVNRAFSMPSICPENELTEPHKEYLARLNLMLSKTPFAEKYEGFYLADFSKDCAASVQAEPYLITSPMVLGDDEKKSLLFWKKRKERILLNKDDEHVKDFLRLASSDRFFPAYYTLQYVLGDQIKETSDELPEEIFRKIMDDYKR